MRRVKTRDPGTDAASASGSDRNGGGSGRRSDDDDDDQEDYVDNDSKETRLTLMEEVLLLGLKEKEVSGTSGRLDSFDFVVVNKIRFSLVTRFNQSVPWQGLLCLIVCWSLVLWVFYQH